MGIKEKSPFIGFSIQEINVAERNSFVIQVGNDFYSKDGSFVFTLAQAQKSYEILLLNIIDTINGGTPKQRAAALNCLARLHIMPLKLQ